MNDFTRILLEGLLVVLIVIVAMIPAYMLMLSLTPAYLALKKKMKFSPTHMKERRIHDTDRRMIQRRTDISGAMPA